MRNAPTEGEIVYVQGYEFVATNVQVVDGNYPVRNPEGNLVLQPEKVCRFKGVCTGNRRNDGIRYTGFNGGVYGWRVA